MIKHIGKFSREDAEKILSGEKVLEVVFSKSKSAPFGVISAGDLVYIKSLGKEVIGQFRVKKVITYDGIEPSDFLEIEKKYNLKITPLQKASRYVTLIFIGTSLRFITSPIKLPKKNNKSWVVLG